MNATARHLRSNAIAYLALFISLAGTSYAALRIPANSVGERQLRNHAIDPVKFNPRYIGGYVRKWVTVDASGKVIAAGGKVKVTMPSWLPPAHYIVDWQTNPVMKCAAVVSIDEHNLSNSSPQQGYDSSVTTQNRSSGVRTVVATFDQAGNPVVRSFDIGLLC